jgi:hypothetical protein
MRSKAICILLVGIACSLPAVLTGAFAEDVKVTCPGKGCPCTTVKVHECDAKSDGTLYNCHDVNELQCTITAPSHPLTGKAVKVHPK